ncbi:MAG: 5-oxoprolinase subunit PxpA [Halioglobus sp.]|nr:5-oxoprolinase subunit PxpA [Halioglobus sp.]
MLLNCDLGESYGHWAMGMDSAVMPHIDQANIACGFHGGDPVTLRKTLALAARYGVTVGAHPSYPDLVGFGRRSMRLSAEETIAALHYQMAALEGLAACQGLRLGYIKPHGALYNDMMTRAEVRAAVLEAVASYHTALPLMVPATLRSDAHRREAAARGVSLQFEAFADRCYDDAGNLLPRSEPGAVLDRQRMLAQVEQLLADGTVTTASGRVIALQADTLCVHGDNPQGVAAIEAIRALVGGR